MKALEKDRNRRYETANGFAADVQRYLADEPVQACPPSAGIGCASSVGGTRGRCWRPGWWRWPLFGGRDRSGVRLDRGPEATRSHFALATGRGAQREARRRRAQDGERRPGGKAEDGPGRSWPPSEYGRTMQVALQNGGTTTSPRPWACSRVPGPTCAAGSGTTSTASATPISSHFTAIDRPSYRWHSARTGAGRDRRVRTRRRRCGTQDRGRVLTLKGHTGRSSVGGVQPGRVAGRHRRARTGRRRCGTRGRGARGPHPQGAHRARSRSAAFSPDGSRVVDREQDRTARVWDATTGAEVLALKGHTGTVESAAFSPDGSRVVTGSDGQDGARCGTRGPGPRSSPSRGTPAASRRRRSARTGRGS